MDGRKERLEKKWWYRLAKVLYILVYILVVLVISFAANEEKPKTVIDDSASFITCLSSNKTYSLRQNEIYIYGSEPSYSDEQQMRLLCQYNLMLLSPDRSHPDPVTKNYTLTTINKTDGDFSSWTRDIILWLTGTVVIMYVVKSAFIYIAAGKKDIEASDA